MEVMINTIQNGVGKFFMLMYCWAIFMAGVVVLLVIYNSVNLLCHLLI